ncbi:hypothetical protein CY34DRAFT_75146, partial [Suillus luteus UH-Slu-Lm8-n1]
FLGIIIDNELTFKKHTIYALAKGTQYTMACQLMKGIYGQLLKKLHEGVDIPKMLYTADIWCSGLVLKGRGKKNTGREAKGFTLKMARVQRMATTIIMRGMKTTTTDLLDAHANILPFQ